MQRPKEPSKYFFSPGYLAERFDVYTIKRNREGKDEVWALVRKPRKTSLNCGSYGKMHYLLGLYHGKYPDTKPNGPAPMSLAYMDDMRWCLVQKPRDSYPHSVKDQILLGKPLLTPDQRKKFLDFS